jgi:hypothetical protein
MWTYYTLNNPQSYIYWWSDSFKKNNTSHQNSSIVSWSIIYAVPSDNTYYRSKFSAITEGVLVQNTKMITSQARVISLHILHFFCIKSKNGRKTSSTSCRANFYSKISEFMSVTDKLNVLRLYKGSRPEMPKEKCNIRLVHTCRALLMRL